MLGAIAVGKRILSEASEIPPRSCTLYCILDGAAFSRAVRARVPHDGADHLSCLESLGHLTWPVSEVSVRIQRNLSLCLGHPEKYEEIVELRDLYFTYLCSLKRK